MVRLGAILKFQEAPVKIFKIMLVSERKLEDGISEQILQKVGPLVWDSGVPRKAKTAQPVPIRLQPGVASPHRKQYPTKWEALGHLQPIIEGF